MVLLAALAVLAIVPIYYRLGSEFMPPLWEETSMYMPVSLPGASIETMREAIQRQDRVIMGFPEVASVFAKAGRAETATDPAPLEMVETVIQLKPADQWRPGMTHDRLIAEMDEALRGKQVGFTNSWTMPIKGRIDMLSTGIRTPIGVKVFGPDLKEIGRIGQEIEQHVGMVPGTRSAFAERVAEGYYLDFTPRRDAIARYGLTIADVQEVIQSAVGGANVTTTIEGRERYPVNVRYGAGLPQRPVAAAPGAGGDAHGDAGAAGRTRRSAHRHRAGHGQERGGAARRLRLHRHGGARPRRLRAGRKAMVEKNVEVPPGLSPRMERRITSRWSGPSSG